MLVILTTISYSVCFSNIYDQARPVLMWLIDWSVKWVADESTDRYNNDTGETASEHPASFQRSFAPDRRRVCWAGVYHSQKNKTTCKQRITFNDAYHCIHSRRFATVASYCFCLAGQFSRFAPVWLVTSKVNCGNYILEREIFTSQVSFLYSANAAKVRRLHNI